MAATAAGPRAGQLTPRALPELRLIGSPAGMGGAVLVAHGGAATGLTADSLLRGPALRMAPFALGLWRAGRNRGLVVALLRYRHRGYNDGDPVADVEWALERLDAISAGAPVCLLGHSMGARASLRAAGHHSVIAVAALAPWLPPEEPVAQLAGRRLLLAHGSADRVTDPWLTAAYARRAEPVAAAVESVEIAGSGHAMLGRAREWHTCARRFCLSALAI